MTGSVQFVDLISSVDLHLSWRGTWRKMIRHRIVLFNSYDLNCSSEEL